MSIAERQIKATKLMKLYSYAGAWKYDVLIGFAGAVSDGDFRAYIEDVVIHKEYQKSGIGTKIVSLL